MGRTDWFYLGNGHMTCEQCTSLPGLVADSSLTSSLDIRQLSLLSGSGSNVKFSEKEQRMDGSQGLKSMREMYGYSMGPCTREKWIAYMRDSLAKIYPMLAKGLEWEKAQEAASMGKYYGSLGRYDQNTFSLKTSQLSLIEDMNSSSQTWPRWGFLQDGVAYVHPMSERRMPVIGGGVWLPTPLKTDGMKFLKFKLKSVLKPTFGTHVNSIPYYLAANYGRIPSAEILTWAMGWPNGWVRLNLQEMDKSHSKPQSHGNSLAVNE